MSIETQTLTTLLLSNAFITTFISVIFYRKLNIRLLGEQVKTMRTEMSFIGVPGKSINYKDVHTSYHEHILLFNKNSRLLNKNDIQRINRKIENNIYSIERIKVNNEINRESMIKIKKSRLECIFDIRYSIDMLYITTS